MFSMYNRKPIDKDEQQVTNCVKQRNHITIPRGAITGTCPISWFDVADI